MSFQAANHLLRPSYVSMETAMWLHGTHPEACFSMVSAALEDALIENEQGRFYYHRIKPEAFHFGFEKVELYGTSFLLADAEKALLDYFHVQGGEWTADRIAAQRFEGDDIDPDRLMEYAQRYSSLKVERAARRFMDYVKKEAAEFRPL